MTQCVCGHKIVQPRGNGEFAIKNRVLLAKSDGIYAVCPTCKAEVRVEELQFKVTAHVILNKSQGNNNTGLTK